jgi:hypothetical protein
LELIDFKEDRFKELLFLTHLTQNEQNEEARNFEKSINSKSAAILY